MTSFIEALADGGDGRAAAFLNKLLGGGFDWPPGETKRHRKGDGDGAG